MKPVRMLKNKEIKLVRLCEEKVNALREPHKGVISHKGTMLQSQTGEELGALSLSLAKHPERASVASGIPSVLDRAFKGEL